MNKQEEATAGFLLIVGLVCIIVGFIGSCLISLWALAIFALAFFGMVCVMTAVLSAAGALNPSKNHNHLKMNERYCYSRPKGKNKKFKNGSMKF